MALWIDKYRPTTLDKVDYHKEQAQQLKKIVKSGDVPHLLIYGPSGAGKKTRIMCILNEIYGSGVEKMRITHETISAPSGKKIEVSKVESNHHIELSPGDAGIHDRVVVQEVIKNTASNRDPTGQDRFKTVVLKEVDGLTRDAQHALRRTMEKYMSNCRLILCCRSISKVISPLRSRCLAVRVAAPNDKEVISVIENVCKKEKVEMDPQFAERVAEKCAGNLRRALLMCEAAKVAANSGGSFRGIPGDQEIPDLDWEAYLKKTAAMIVEEQTPQRLLKVRERLYELLAHCIPADVIFRELLVELIRSCDAQQKPDITEAAAAYEHRLQMGSKSIYHLEAFVAKFMSIYKKYLETMMDFF